MIRRKLLIILLFAGTVVGFGHGFRSLACRRGGHRAAIEQHVAKVCIEAARKSCPTIPAAASPPTVFVLPPTAVVPAQTAPAVSPSGARTAAACATSKVAKQAEAR